MYRASWALIALPLLLAAFTVGRPDPLPPPDLPPSFDETAAAQLAEELARVHPARVPGTPEARAAARWVAEQLEAYNLNAELRPFVAEIPGRGRVTLVNVVATPLRIAGPRSPEAIVILANRDNLGASRGLNDNASGTAALIELARNLSTLTVSHRIVFVSTDGGAFGNLGAARLAADPAFRDGVLAVVSLDTLGGPGPPRLQLAGDGARSPVGVLLATAEASVVDEAGAAPARPSAFEQLLDLAFPFSLADQAPFLGAGVSAVTLTSAGDRPLDPAEDDALDQASLGALGRAAQALVSSLDGAAEVTRGTDSLVYLGGRYIRGAAIELVLLVALVPFLVAVVDLYARLRRRGCAIGPALRSYRSRLLVWTWVAGLAAVFTAVGLFPGGEPRPLSPDTSPARDWPLEALVGLAALSGAGWLLARVRLVRRAPVERTDELAGHLVALLALAACALTLAFANPFSVLLVLPALHVWLFAPHVRDAHPALRALFFAAGLAGPAILLSSFAVRYDLGFDAAWYVATLFSVGYASTALCAAIVLFAAAAGQIAAVLFGRYAPYPTPGTGPARGPVRQTVRALVLARRRQRRAAAAGPRREEGASPAEPPAAGRARARALD